MSYRRIAEARYRERRLKAWRLRLQGKSMREIAEALGVGLAQVHRDIHAHDEELREREVEHAEQYRQIQLERLESVVAAFWDTALAGDPRAAAILLRVLDAENRLLGLSLAPGTSALYSAPVLPDLPDWADGV